MNEYEAIMKELNNALNKKAEAEVGASSPAKQVPGESPISRPTNDESDFERQDKSVAYQDSAEHQGDGGAPKLTSEVGKKPNDVADAEEEMAEEGPEHIKKASARTAEGLLRKIDSYVSRLESAPSIKKSAAYVKGERAATAYIDFLIKQAEDTLQVAHNVLATCVKGGHLSPEGRDEIIAKMSTEVDMSPEKVMALAGDAYVGEKLVAAMFPHLVSDNKSPEVAPQQPSFEPAKAQQKAVDPMAAAAGQTNQVMGKEAQYKLLVKKAQIYEALEKAAASKDPKKIEAAKAEFFKFLGR